jgi:hypothetical protein
MARATMANLIQETRLLADVGASDYTAGTVSYWTDDQIESILDQNRRDIRYQVMDAVPTFATGGATYTEYWTGLSSWEDSPVILDGTYGTITGGTAVYSFDANAGVATFTANTLGQTRIMLGAVYNLNAAAAVIWTRKAAHYAKAYDTNTDNHILSRSQLVKNCRDMARTFTMMPPSWERGRGSPGSGSIYAERGDM